MGKYQEDAKLLLEYVGGKENIAAVSHCVCKYKGKCFFVRAKFRV